MSMNKYMVPTFLFSLAISLTINHVEAKVVYEMAKAALWTYMGGP